MKKFVVFDILFTEAAQRISSFDVRIPYQHKLCTNIGYQTGLHGNSFNKFREEDLFAFCARHTVCLLVLTLLRIFVIAVGMPHLTFHILIDCMRFPSREASLKLLVIPGQHRVNSRDDVCRRISAGSCIIASENASYFFIYLESDPCN